MEYNAIVHLGVPIHEYLRYWNMRDFIILADADCEMTYQAADELGVGMMREIPLC